MQRDLKEVSTSRLENYWQCFQPAILQYGCYVNKRKADAKAPTHL